MSFQTLDTNRKALQINLDNKVYGTFAEIGAGQEVARYFFKAGAASNTIAKAMSAYDMIFSNEIYGLEPSGRYVTKSRLIKMLDHEFSLLSERLHGEKYDYRTFFAFADTVTTLNFSKTNDPHGWLGIRFQTKPGGEANEIFFHVRLLDRDVNLQQNVLGTLGVNLVYAAFNHQDDIKQMIESLADNIATDSVEIDLINVAGPHFKDVDQILINLYLIQKGYASAAVFDSNSDVLQAKDLMYKKHVMLLRTKFKEKKKLHFNMFNYAVEQYKKDMKINDNEQLITLAELTLNNLMEKAEKDNDLLLKDVAKRAKDILKTGQKVIITNFSRNNKLAAYISICKPISVGMTTNVINLKYIFTEENYSENYTNLLLAYISDIFSRNVKLYAYPFKNKKEENTTTLKNLNVSKSAMPLFNFLLQNNYIIDVEESSSETINALIE